MHKIAWVVCLLLLSQSLAFAGDKPLVFTGTIGKHDDPSVTAAIGHHGALLIGSAARWDEIKKLMPGIKPDKPLPEINFDKQAVVMIYADDRHDADAFTLDSCDLTAKPPQLDFTLQWDNGQELQKRPRFTKFILAVIAAAPAVKITVLSLPMLANRSHPVTEFSAIIGDKWSDVVDGLQAGITPKTAVIKPGEDILIDFALNLADPGDARPQQFGPTSKSIYVWNGGVSAGYCNFAFIVTNPAGKTTLLRPAQPLWNHNAELPPVEVTADKPYHLPCITDGSTYKPLKELGVDTATPGTYTITGLYEEAGSIDADKHVLWGGSIMTNTISVIVKP